MTSASARGATALIEHAAAHTAADVFAANDDAGVALDAAIRQACDSIAPLWPLKSFVAVNPFLGFSSQTFEATCATLKRVTRAPMLMPRAFYREAIAAGVVRDSDLASALAAMSAQVAVPDDVAALKALAARDVTPERPRHAVVATVAEVLDALAAGDRQVSRTAFMVDEISKWCAAYFDQGQAAWKLPSRKLAAYPAWRQSMRYDLNPGAMGLKGFRRSVSKLPEDPVQAIGHIVTVLGLPPRAVADYLYRALFDIGGWAAYARYLVWDNQLYGRSDDTLVHLLAIRLAWGYALFVERTDPEFREAWQAAMTAAAATPLDEQLGGDAELAVDLVLHNAYERAYQRRLLEKLSVAIKKAPHAAATRPPVQAAFCIDVRSEVYRRALETVNPGVATIGFAGFFGFPIEYVPIGNQRGGAHCPVLLTPAFTVCEAVTQASEEEEIEILGLRLLRRRAAKAWKSFKLSAVSSFTYVETAGLLFAAKIIGDAAGLTRTVTHPSRDGLDPHTAGRVGPRIAPRSVGGRMTGFDEAQRLAMAEAVLRAMSMTAGFARLVMLTGHGSTTVNNPYASGLDCGACGGHTGDANARVAALILNDPGVRQGLVGRGITIPADTWFLGCLHDTTTDEITIFEDGDVPPSHTSDLAQLKRALQKASSLARAERAVLLNMTRDSATKDGAIDDRVIARSRDWSQVRPEWGLAGNACFIAAPRRRTAGLALDGRSFLHDYDWQADQGFGVLDLIMTAPMVVASWINLQYYGSTVDNRVFGSGNKTLHNVVGTLGVLEGNAGDLRVGLPWQSVHDGQRFVHEPLRLNVFIEAPQEAINAVITKHDGVRHLVDNRWIHLYRIDTATTGIARYTGGLSWHPI